MSFEHGLEYINQPNQERKIRNRWIENVGARAKVRIQMFKNGQISCIGCGLTGSHWHIERAINDFVMPFSINLYALKPCSLEKGGFEEVMLTMDHILPRSLGGSDQLENAQCMCSDCNNKKANLLTLPEIVSIITSPHIFQMYKVSGKIVGDQLTQTLSETIQLATLEHQKLTAYVPTNEERTKKKIFERYQANQRRQSEGRQSAVSA